MDMFIWVFMLMIAACLFFVVVLFVSLLIPLLFIPWDTVKAWWSKVSRGDKTEP